VLTVQLRIGISGWSYAGWRGTFYPQDLIQRRELAYAGERFGSIEINGSFYSLQRPASYQHWFEQTPDAFLFSVKGGRYITHLRRLKDVARPLANFFASGVLCLREKLGPILWQFPPRMTFDASRMETFFDMLPRTTRDAAKLARKHDPWMNDRVFTTTDADRPLRYAIEVRSESFFNRQYIRMLRRQKMAWVMSQGAQRWPYAEEVTADFIYLRLHGATELYAGGYCDEQLARWARRIEKWQAGNEPRDRVRITDLKAPPRKHRDAFIYFDNDAKVQAPFNAMRLMEIMRVSPAGVVP
jgi:uncharacterized protein YecE (DUF72 family)